VGFFISVGLGNPGNFLPHKIMLIKLIFKLAIIKLIKGAIRSLQARLKCLVVKYSKKYIDAKLGSFRKKCFLVE
jgi:hypothetical protein